MTTYDRPYLSIVIPVFNEQDNLQELYERLEKVMHTAFAGKAYEYVFVDDGSHDLSAHLLQRLREQNNAVKFIQFSRNFGHHIAITAGLDHAQGTYVVTMDGDLQDLPEEIPTLYQALGTKSCDVIFGERIHKQFSWYRRTCSTFFVRTIKFLINEKIEINSAIFRIMKRQVVQKTREVRERNRYMVGVIGWVGFKHASVPVTHGQRMHGVSKYPFVKQLKLALDAIFSFSDYPLKLITRLGFLLVCFSMLLVGIVCFRRLIYGISVVGWSSIMSAIMFIGGVQIFMLGLVGEYIGRSYVEVKQRPLYVIRRTEGLGDDAKHSPS